MAIALRGSVTYGNPGNVSTITVTKPTGLAANDVCLIEMLLYDGSVQRTINSVPSGWNALTGASGVNWNPSGAFMTMYRYWYRATGSDPASWSWTLTAGSAFVQYQIATYTGCHTTLTPAEWSTTGQSTTAQVGAAAPTLTVTYANSKLVFMANNLNGRTYTPPGGAGWTERHEDSGTNNYWADKDIGAGATGTITFNQSSSDPWFANLVALIDAGAGGATGATMDGAVCAATAGSPNAAAAAGALMPGQAAAATGAGPTASVGVYAVAVAQVASATATAPNATAVAGAVVPGALAPAAATSPAGVLVGAAVLASGVGQATATSPSGAIAAVNAGTILAQVGAATGASPAATVQAGALVAGALTAAMGASPSSALVGGAALLGAFVAAVAGSPNAGALAGAVAMAALVGATARSPAATIDVFAGGAGGGEPAGYGPTRVVVTSRVRRAVLASSRRVARITSQGG